MRLAVCLCTFLGVVQALFVAVPASAQIKPLPKPAGAAVRTTHTGIAPLVKPVVHQARKPVHAASQVRTTRPSRHTVARRPVRVLARSRGGRREPLRISGGRRLATVHALPAIPSPTPLGFVGIGDVLPASATPWPGWMLALLALLSAGEALVLVRLVQIRRASY